MAVNKMSRRNLVRSSLTMAVVDVVSALIVWTVLLTGLLVRGRDHGVYRYYGRHRIEGSYDPRDEPSRHYDPGVPTRKNYLPYKYSDFPDHRSKKNPEYQLTSGEGGSREYDRYPRPRYSPSLYPVFIPIQYDLNRNGVSDRSIAPEDQSPRMIMDKDFNIRFDNPYITPLTKPLALILNSAVNARGDHDSSEKLVIPLPVLVKTRSSSPEHSLEHEDLPEFRGDEIRPEHRSNNNYEDDVYVDSKHSVKEPPKKLLPGKVVYRTNGTTTYHNINYPSEQEDGTFYNVRENHVSKGGGYTSNVNQDFPVNSASQEDGPLDVYPSKIFADMYKTIPKYPPVSLESQEFRGIKYNDDTKRAYSKDNVESLKKLIQQRQNLKPNDRYPYRGHAFSASTDLGWVTDTNSTKSRVNSTNNEVSSSFTVYEVREAPESDVSPTLISMNTTVTPTNTTNSATYGDIKNGYWRKRLV